MKKENVVLYVVRLAVTLLVIAGVMAAALAGVNSVTAPIIEKLTYEKTQKAVSAGVHHITICIFFPRSTRVKTATLWKSPPPVSTTPSP